MLFAPGSACAQHFSLGVIGGVALTDAVQGQTLTSVDVITQYASNSRDYLLGPMAELSLPFGLAVEFDAMYRPMNYTLTTTVIPQTSSSVSVNNQVGSWEFPLLLKYKFAFPVIHPFVEAGPSFRATGSGASPSNHGITIGGGLEAHLLRIKIAPQLRFTRWGSNNITSNLPPQPLTNLNQAEFLVSLAF